MMVPTDESSDDLERSKRIRHVIIVSVDGQSAPDRELTQVPYLDSVFRVLGAVASTAIDRYGFETLIHARDMTERLAAGLARRGCPLDEKGKPYECRTVAPHFAHVSLGDLQDDEEKRKLAAIPTGLTIDGPDVDAIIAAGRDAVLCDEDMRRALENLPGARVPPRPARCNAYYPSDDEVSASTAERTAARASRTERP